MLSKRILTAIIGVAVAAFVIQYGQWLFTMTVAGLSLTAWYEYCAMLQVKKFSILRNLGFCAILLLFGCAWLGNSQETVLVIVAVTVFALLHTVISAKGISIVDAGLTIFGLIYIGLLFTYLVLLRFSDLSLQLPNTLNFLSPGTAFLWVALIGTWSSDTFAYFIGTQFGKHKLCPTISPQKTVEGAIGGIAGCILIITFLGIWMQLSTIHSLFLGVLIAIIAPVGDLVESALKRFAGVKDSGRVLPGHGGILDRFDSILFTVPAVYYYVQIILLYQY
ncbi:MAG: phosphatidate cytidylyltransferase [Veillonellales bacterium]